MSQEEVLKPSGDISFPEETPLNERELSIEGLRFAAEQLGFKKWPLKKIPMLKTVSKTLGIPEWTNLIRICDEVKRWSHESGQEDFGVVDKSVDRKGKVFTEYDAYFLARVKQELPRRNNAISRGPKLRTSEIINEVYTEVKNNARNIQ